MPGRAYIYKVKDKMEPCISSYANLFTIQDFTCLQTREGLTARLLQLIQLVVNFFFRKFLFRYYWETLFVLIFVISL